MTTYIPLSKTESECYICGKLDIDLTKPCNNSECNILAHCSCLEQQWNQDQKICQCGVPLIVKTVTKFNKFKFVKLCVGLIYTFLMLIGGSIMAIILALGKTTNTYVRSDCNVWKDGVNPNYKCDHIEYTILAVLPFVFLIWQIPPLTWKSKKSIKYRCRYNVFCCRDPYKNTKLRSYLTMILMLICLNGIVVLAHLIGHPVIKFMYKTDDFFTWQTSLAGFVVYYILILAVIVLVLICGLIRLFCVWIIGHSTKTEHVFGGNE